MKTRTRNRIAAALLTLGVSIPAHASPTCLASGPACALVLLGAVVTTIVHEPDEHEARDTSRKHAPPEVSVHPGAHPERDPRIFKAPALTRGQQAVREVRR